ncbi:MAG: hypothetical protein CMQ31_07925 [Gammaproteobacteria bacterium]|nr:hypothetical protein [Gammaproteobacteria bacterium]
MGKKGYSAPRLANTMTFNKIARRTSGYSPKTTGCRQIKTATEIAIKVDAIDDTDLIRTFLTFPGLQEKEIYETLSP